MPVKRPGGKEALMNKVQINKLQTLSISCLRNMYDEVREQAEKVQCLLYDSSMYDDCIDHTHPRWAEFNRLMDQLETLRTDSNIIFDMIHSGSFGSDGEVVYDDIAKLASNTTKTPVRKKKKKSTCVTTEAPKSEQGYSIQPSKTVFLEDCVQLCFVF